MKNKINKYKIINELKELDFESLIIGDKFIELHSSDNGESELDTVNIGCLTSKWKSLYGFSLITNLFELTPYNDDMAYSNLNCSKKELNLLLIRNHIVKVDTFMKTTIYQFDKADTNNYNIIYNLINSNNKVSCKTIHEKKDDCNILKHYITIDIEECFIAAIVTNSINSNQKRLLKKINYYLFDKELSDFEMLDTGYTTFSISDNKSLLNALLDIRESLSEEEKNNMNVLISNIETNNVSMSDVVRNGVLNQTIINSIYKSVENNYFDYMSEIDKILDPIIVDEKYNYKAYIFDFKNNYGEVFSTFSNDSPIDEICKLERKAESILKYNTEKHNRIINIFTGQIIDTKYEIIYSDSEGIIMYYNGIFSGREKIFFKKILDVYCQTTNSSEKNEIMERYEICSKLAED